MGHYDDAEFDAIFEPRRRLAPARASRPTPDYLAARASVLLDQLADIEDQLTRAEMERRIQAQLRSCLPPTDEFENGVILVINKRYAMLEASEGDIPDVEYTYIAGKIAGRWWLTGTRNIKSGQRYDWLVDFVVFNTVEIPKIWIATQLEEFIA